MTESQKRESLVSHAGPSRISPDIESGSVISGCVRGTTPQSPRKVTTDDREHPAVPAEGPANRGRIQAEPPLPICIADYCNRCWFAIDLGIEGPPGKRGNAEHRIIIAGHQFRAHRLRVHIEDHVAAAHRRLGKHIFETVEILAKLTKQRIRKDASKLHEPLGLMDRYHPQGHGVHQAEDRGIRADPQGQGNNRGHGE